MKVLIIDDDQEDTSLFCEALAEVQPAASCLVLHTCVNIRFLLKDIGHVDIIFLDGHMYPIGGKECLEQLLTVVDRSRTKIVIHSGSLSPTEQSELESLGVDYFLLKVPSYETLKSNISEVINACYIRKQEHS